MTTYTATQKRYGLNNMNAYAQRAKLGDLVYNGAGGGYPLDYPGSIYYVNNVTGSSTNDGLSWATAFDEVSTAITASEVARNVFITAHANNLGIRNIIYVQGTNLPYAALAALPLHCSIVGVGDQAYGNGQGIPVIGTTAAGLAGVSGVVTQGTTVRGCEFYNVQFTAGGTSTWCFDCVGSFLRGAFVNCSFLINGSTTTGGCLRAQSSFAGNWISHCQFTGDSGYPAYGIYLTGGSINNNIIENNIINGTTAGVLVAGGDDINTVWRDNTIGLTYGTYGVEDSGSYSIWSHNYCIGSTAGMLLNTNPTRRAIANYVIDAGEGHMYTPVHTSTTST